MTASHVLRLHVPVALLTIVPAALALRFGGYHPRHGGWVVLALAIWACIQAARGRLSDPRSPSGIATFALLALVAWTTASMMWADLSIHDAWIEAMRAAGYAAAFVLGGSLLANARTYARFATLAGIAIAVVCMAAALRVRMSDAPMSSFVAGRLDWPIGYAPGLAGFALVGAFLLFGSAVGADRRWALDRDPRELVAGGLALGGAGACGAVALLAQSRGTLPAIAVGLLVSVVAMPQRTAWLLRVVVVGIAMWAVSGRLGTAYSTQFDLRQAPFTEGAAPDALLAVAEAAARSAATTVLLVAVALALLGVALVPIGASVAERIGTSGGRVRQLGAQVAIALVVMVVTLCVLTADRPGSPGHWAAEQWRGCTDPPKRTNDPGSGASYFANTGTGRCDYYRVALRAFGERPLLGLGAGNFRGEYVRERETTEEPRVVHSLPLQLLAELGLLGALLGATVLGCVGWAAWRFVGSGGGRDATFAGAIGALGYWTAHASIDWLWQLPAVSLTAVLLAGGLVACVSPAQRRVRTAIAAPIAAGAMLASIALVLPVTMADSALRRARDPELRKQDPKAALEAARDARSFDPSWSEPMITEGVLLAAAGQRTEAADAARDAVEAEPRNWSAQFRASGLIGLDDTNEGRAAFRAARALNPQLPANVPDEETPARRASTDPDSLQNPDA